MNGRTRLLGRLAAVLLVCGLVGHAQATPVEMTVGAFDLTFYNNHDSDGESRGRKDWTTQEMDDVAASIAVWTGRLTNTPGRQIQFHLFWNSFSGGTLADYSGPSNGNGTTSWTYVEHVWRDGVNYTGPWTGFDCRIRFDIEAAGYAWNLGSGPPASNQIDFRSVVTHEVGHAVGVCPSYYPGNDLWGLCWGTSKDPFASAGYKGLSEWDKDLLDNASNRPANQATGTPGDFNEEANPVWFTGANAVDYYGGNVPVYAPSTYQSGSSLSHLDESWIPGALMSPYVTLGEAIRQPLRLEWEIMKDLGWSVLTTKTWTKGGGTLGWTNAANWSPDGTPDATWDVLLDGAGLADGDVLNLGGNQSVNLLSIDTTAAFSIGGSSGTLTIVKGNLTRSAASSGVQTIARPVALGKSAIWDIAGSGRLAVSGRISGSGCGIEKRGQGTLLLAGDNTYTGATNVNAGTLWVSNSSGSGTGAGTVNVGVNGTLGGSGAISGATFISGHHTPGTSAGVQTFGNNLTYNPGADVTWELVANSATQGSPAVFDQILVGLGLDFAGTTALILKFDAAESAVDWTHPFWDDSRNWLVFDVAGTTSDFSNLALTVADWADSNGTPFDSAQPGKYFFLSSPSGEDVMLNYLVPGDANLDRNTNALDYVVVSNHYNDGSQWAEGDVNGDGEVNAPDYVEISNHYGSHAPEPATMALLALGGLGLALGRKRR